MALSRHIPINNELVFPAGAYAVGGVEQVVDFEASTPRAAGPGARSRLGFAPLGDLGVRRRSRGAHEGRPGQDRGPYPAVLPQAPAVRRSRRWRSRV